MKSFTLVACLAVVCLTPAAALSYNTQSFFLVIIDGLRNQEAFEDSTHSYIPHIWNDLRPLGTIYTNFYTMIRTGTTPGHQLLVTGVRNDMVNNHAVDLPQFRSRYPTVFEYFRKTTGIPADSVWIVSGKRNLNTCDYSLHPAYGEEYGASIISDVGFDTIAYQAAIDVIDTHHPRLMLFNLKDVDKWGHVGTFEEYTTAIQIADSLVFELFNHVESDSFYAGKTTFFITTDHGRIDDLHGGYHHHGLGTHGDRSCYFVAIGPDIRVSHVVEDTRRFCDVAPTIGELMGFETPFAEGKVMRNMFVETPSKNSAPSPVSGLRQELPYINLSNSADASLFPSIAVASGFVDVVWSERDTAATNENWQIRYVRSSDGGVTWSSPEVLFENHQEDGTVYRGDVFRGEDSGLIATVNGYFGYTDPLGKRTYKWFSGYSSSGDGAFWIAPGVLTKYGSEWKTIILNPPRIAADSLETEIDWISETWFTAKARPNDNAPWNTRIDYTQPRLFPNEYYSCHDVAMDANRVYYVAERNTLSGSEIYCLPYDRETGSLGRLARIDVGSAGSFRPCLGTGDDLLHVVWSDLAAGYKGIYHSVSYDRGVTFDPPELVSDPEVDSWNPDLAMNGDTLVVVWEDYRDGTGEIYSRMSTDSGASWGLVTRETVSEGFSVHPRIDVRGPVSSLTWQDMSSGNWEVYVKPLGGE